MLDERFRLQKTLLLAWHSSMGSVGAYLVLPRDGIKVTRQPAAIVWLGEEATLVLVNLGSRNWLVMIISHLRGGFQWPLEAEGML